MPYHARQSFAQILGAWPNGQSALVPPLWGRGCGLRVRVLLSPKGGASQIHSSAAPYRASTHALFPIGDGHNTKSRPVPYAPSRLPFPFSLLLFCHTIPFIPVATQRTIHTTSHHTSHSTHHTSAQLNTHRTIVTHSTVQQQQLEIPCSDCPVLPSPIR
jgi:hypothetical protein